MFLLKMPIFGQLVEKNIVARTTRTLGTLVSSGVPILEALNITKETSRATPFSKTSTRRSTRPSARANRSPSRIKDNSRPGFDPVAMFFWFFFIAGPVGLLMYVTRMNARESSTTWS